MINKKEIGKRLKLARKQIGLSQDDAAFSIKKEKRTINSYETGERTVSLKYLYTLYIKHNVNINWIISGEGEMLIKR